MIGKLKGLIDSFGEDYVILDVNGVGYVVNCSSRTLAHLPRPGEPATLAIETQVREDAIRLFGFLDEAERDWFRLLQSVQGVGAKVALALLSTLSADALAQAVAGQDKAMVARAPGVGPKLAARIVAELKDKAPALAARRFARRAARGGHRSLRRPRRDLGAVQPWLWPSAGAGCGQCEPRGAGPRGGRLGADPARVERTRAVISGMAHACLVVRYRLSRIRSRMI